MSHYIHDVDKIQKQSRREIIAELLKKKQQIMSCTNDDIRKR